MSDIAAHRGSGDVFTDLGFSPIEAAELSAKSALIDAIQETLKARSLTQQEAAQLCGTDQPTLSKVLRGRMESVTIDRLAAWLEHCEMKSVRAAPTNPRPLGGRGC